MHQIDPGQLIRLKKSVILQESFLYLARIFSLAKKILIFIAFGLYALSGAGSLRRRPFIKTALIAIGAIFTLRGVSVIFQIIYLARGAIYPLRYAVFSAVAFIVGLLYLIGTAQQWHDLKLKGKS